MGNRIGFKDLSVPLKVLVVCGWVMLAFWVFGFIVGFILGLLGLM